MKKTTIILTLLVCILLPAQRQTVSANAPYHSYTYDYWEDPVYIPDPYLPESVFTGQGLESGQFSNPQDLTVSSEGDVYVADSGNNRIVILDSDFNYIDTIESFLNDGSEDTFNTPSGVYISDKKEIYIADTNNNRVVILDSRYNLKRIIEDPESEILENNFVFTPLKVAVDYADRVYVVANNMYQGIMTFDERGEFNGFSGTINVSLSFTEKVWRILSTKEQRSRQVLYIPTEFTGLDIDPDGFIYASNIDSRGEQAVRRLNPKGQDVIKVSPRNNLGGDLFYSLRGTHSGPSTIIDVVYRDNGVYSTLDSSRGRIFTYDNEGNLLYIFGGLGTQKGTFRRPVAIEEIKGKIVVLDAETNAILSFEPTHYGSLINSAVEKRYEGDETGTVALWKEVLELDSNNELAYIGIGKSHLATGNNKDAVDYLSNGKDRDYYSIAYKRYRNELMQENFSLVMTSLFVVLILGLIYRHLNKKYHFSIQRLFKLKKVKKSRVLERSEVNV